MFFNRNTAARILVQTSQELQMLSSVAPNCQVIAVIVFFLVRSLFIKIVKDYQNDEKNQNC